MARIAGVDIPNDKRIVISLTYIYGIGTTRAKEICEKAGFKPELRTRDMTEAQMAQLRHILESDYKLEGDLRRETGAFIKRLMDLSCYRGLRHKKGLPVRGQSTRQNARTRKGPRKTIANKKKAV